LYLLPYIRNCVCKTVQRSLYPVPYRCNVQNDSKYVVLLIRYLIEIKSAFLIYRRHFEIRSLYQPVFYGSFSLGVLILLFVLFVFCAADKNLLVSLEMILEPSCFWDCNIRTPCVYSHMHQYTQTLFHFFNIFNDALLKKFFVVKISLLIMQRALLVAEQFWKISIQREQTPCLGLFAKLAKPSYYLLRNTLIVE